eukprot:TRINITY_DN10199_c0_g2_i3.p1 TRINITY_DN10199_c0_g2~~TRINITY_DN10199_c0_g2_i3.p1  ORF type:complete len:353 (+),score=99.06 TRINITY_DN10199_c0_g2_i3:470-1528(+)
MMLRWAGVASHPSMEPHAALSEFIFAGAAYFVSHKVTRDRVELLFIRGDGLHCYRGGRAVNDVKIRSLKKSAYLEFVRNALGQQDMDGAKYVYELAPCGDAAADSLVLTVMIKVAHGEGDGGGILLKGLEVTLTAAPPAEQGEAVCACLRQQAIASHAALTTQAAFTAAKAELAAYKALCETSVAGAAESEALMLAAGLKVLNEKKAKLYELSEECKRLQAHSTQVQQLLRTKDEEHKTLLAAHLSLKEAHQALLRRAPSDAVPAPLAPPAAPLVPNPNDPSLDSYPDFTTIHSAHKPGADAPSGGAPRQPLPRQRTRGLSQVEEERAAKRRKDAAQAKKTTSGARALLDFD